MEQQTPRSGTSAEAHDDGGPAFPVNVPEGYPYSGHQPCDGMTLRDYFAAMAMQAAATNPVGANGFSFSERAAWAYQQADAMLAARGGAQ